MKNSLRLPALSEDNALLRPAGVTDRVQIVDVLRGFALFGILVIHSVQNFVNATTVGLMGLGPKNTFVKTSLEFLIEDKFFIIFSFLFGWSFYLIYQHATHKRKPFVQLFVWRLVILLGIGIFHSFFYRSDILQVYAVVGFPLIFCRNLSNRSLLLLCATLFFSSVPCVIYRDEIALNFALLKQHHIPVPSKLSYNLSSGRLFVTSSMFVLGLYAGKTGILQHIAGQDKLLKRIVAASGCSIVLTAIGIRSETLNLGLTHSGIYLSNAIFYCLQNIAFSCFYVSLVTLLYSQRAFTSSLSWLEPLGRMGLTAYIMQSVFFQLFYIYWDGLELGFPGAMLVTFSFYAGQILMAEFWLMHFRHGPMEWIWRSLTYLVTNKLPASLDKD
ncbi:DUF418 domain-containing protein [Dyadobacter sandarakinus]|uniref:DUF418 domain-containing protein n=1 Tax=Dyadobacter sandarakinus TaxID=2747268 RepID=A0ABX7I626_9BACT|nr:DUF418 domain-containing protein [Dyadobacter sandarakinus]QRR00633.1 DUF418 domain-containing protein [Dyadobacter sandarakinus]